MRNPFSQLHPPQRWATRLGALAAAVLLVVLVGGLTAGIILVRHGGTQTGSGQTPTPMPTPGQTAIGTPTPTPVSPEMLNFSNLEMKNATTGWATAYHNPVIDNEPEQILYTTDGGVHWKNVTPTLSGQIARPDDAALSPLAGGGALLSNDFISASAAVVFQAPNHFFVTSDGGQTWQPSTAPGDSLLQYTFLDAQHGWAIAEEQGTIGTFATSNGGATWTRVQSSGNAFPAQDEFMGITFVNQTTGWATFVNVNASSSASLYVTHNGGATWQTQRLALPAGVVAPVFVNAPTFFDSQNGIMEVMFNGLNQINRQAHFQPYSGGGPEALYVTHNGGASWGSPIILQGLEYPDFIDAAHGWALNSTGSALLTTSDSGRDWATVPTSPNFSEMGFTDFISSQIGWAPHYNGTDGYTMIFQTTDGGHTWLDLNATISN